MVINLQGQHDTERSFNLLAWGHWFTFANLILALVVSFFYFSSSPLPDSIVGWLYLLITWIGHFAFLALSCFILTIFPVITLFPYRRHIRGVSAIMAAFFQLFLFLDVLAYRGLGYHLSTSSVDQLSEVEDVYLASLGGGYWVLLLAMFFGILCYQFLVSNLTWKRIHQLQQYKFKNHIATGLLVCFGLSHGMHLWGDATVNTDIAKQSALFPASYPLTAKNLLVRHGLIDINEYNQNKSKLAFVSNREFEIRPTIAPTCDVTAKPNLRIYLLDESIEPSIRSWLQANNIASRHSSQLNFSADMDTNLFNLNTGLPGIYRYAHSDSPLELNKLFGQQKLTIQIHQQTFDIEQDFGKLSDYRVFLFYQSKSEQLFYRTSAIFVGFESFGDVPISAQNIIASYVNKGLDCPEFVQDNLLDPTLEQVEFTDVASNYSDGYFHLIYKDKSMLFSKGQLIYNKTFSTNKNVNEPMDIEAVHKAIDKINGRRITK